MEEHEVKKAKRFNCIAFGVLCAALTSFAAWVIWLCNWPIDPCLKTDSLEEMTASSYLALISETCYELENAEELADLCDFDAWIQTYDAQPGKHILTIKLADEYELAFYEGDITKAYYGYSRKYHLDTAWYLVPESVASALVEYILGNGTVREPYLGVSSWFELDE